MTKESFHFRPGWQLEVFISSLYDKRKFLFQAYMTTGSFYFRPGWQIGRFYFKPEWQQEVSISSLEPGWQWEVSISGIDNRNFLLQTWVTIGNIYFRPEWQKEIFISGLVDKCQKRKSDVINFYHMIKHTWQIISIQLGYLLSSLSCHLELCLKGLLPYTLAMTLPSLLPLEHSM